MWAPLLGFLAGILPWLVTRVISLLGFGVVTYYGFDLLAEQLQGFVNEQVSMTTSGLSGDWGPMILMIIELSGLLDGLQMIVSAFATAFGFGIITKFTGIKSSS